MIEPFSFYWPGNHWVPTMCLAVCIHAQSLQLCPTLVTRWTINLPGFSVHGILQAKTLEWVAVASSRGSSWLILLYRQILHLWVTGETCLEVWLQPKTPRLKNSPSSPVSLLSVLSVSLAWEASASWPFSLLPRCPWLPNSIQTPEISF